MMHNGLNLSDAIVKEMGTSGEHDGVADLVENEAECDEVGKVSVEIKCQRLWSEQGKTNVRKALRKEEVEECIWWQRALGKRGAEWVGRAILLVCVGQSGNVSSKAEWKPVQAGWRVLWGWNSVHIDPPRVNLVRHAAPKAAVAPKAVPAPKARSSPKSKPFPTYQYRKAQNYWAQDRFVANVDQLLTYCGKRADKPGRNVSQAKKARTDLGADTPNGVHTSEVLQIDRVASKRGGKKQWVATSAAMKKLYDSWLR